MGFHFLCPVVPNLLARDSQSLRVANGHILTAPVGMMGHFPLGLPLAQSLLQGIQYEVGMGS
ncbi:hypothetical protein MSKU15_0430 [Komagataeibacter diospyri]|nr:hypothetical protein MSKU15_0430 [Komagataeibacter diospyri]